MFYADVSNKLPHPSRRSRKRSIRCNGSKPISWKKAAICLRSRLQKKGPDMQEKMILAKAGLGLKELTFDSDGDALHIHHVINDAFQPLLRLANNSSTLLEIEPPKGGMNVKYLRDILKSAKLFIRPLQSDVNVDEINLADLESEVRMYAQLRSYSVACVHIHPEHKWNLA